MKKILMIFCLLNATMAFGEAPDNSRDLLWTCDLAFTAQGSGFAIFLGSYKLQGKGRIVCVNEAGETETLPVKLAMTAENLSGRVAIGKIDFSGRTLEAGVMVTRPKDMLGNYAVSDVSGAFILGAGVMTAAKTDFTDLTLAIGIEITRRLGFTIGIGELKITLDPSRS